MVRSYPSRRPFRTSKPSPQPLGLGVSYRKSAAAGAPGRRIRIRGGPRARGGLRWVRIRGLQGGIQARLGAGALRSWRAFDLVQEIGHGDHAWQVAEFARGLGDRPGLVPGLQQAGVGRARLACSLVERDA